MIGKEDQLAKKSIIAKAKRPAKFTARNY